MLRCGVKMIVIRKQPGKFPEVIDVHNELSALQEQVGGYIETVAFATDACFICDEEGKLKDKPFNVELLGMPFFGTVLAVGGAGEEFTSLDSDQIGILMLTMIKAYNKAKERERNG